MQGSLVFLLLQISSYIKKCKEMMFFYWHNPTCRCKKSSRNCFSTISFESRQIDSWYIHADSSCFLKSWKTEFIYSQIILKHFFPRITSQIVQKETVFYRTHSNTFPFYSSLLSALTLLRKFSMSVTKPINTIEDSGSGK